MIINLGGEAMAPDLLAVGKMHCLKGFLHGLMQPIG
jgi:hypothetical protein